MTCKGCWWKEGGRCYLEPVGRLADGRSTKLAEAVCSEFKSKRSVLEQVIPGALVILSEGTC